MNLLIGTALAGGLLWLVLTWRVWKSVATKQSPLANTAARTGINRQQYDEAIRSLDRDLAAGDLSEDAYKHELQKVQHRFVQAAEADVDTSWKTSISHLTRASLIVLPLALAGLVFYATSGGMHWQSGEQAQAPASPPDIQAMVSKLASRLETNPDDMTGWMMLGRSYMVLEKFSDAASAFAKANALSPSTDPDLLVGEAEALGLANGQNLIGRPEELIQQALKIDPNNVRGLWFAALAAQMRDAEDEAYAYLDRLAEQPNLPPELQQMLAGIRANKPPNDTANRSETAPYALSVTVQLSSELAAKPAPGSELMLFAKAQGGPPMPVAAQRLAVNSFPIIVELNDSHSVMGSHKISQQSELTLVARLSKSASAQASSGDWEGRLNWTNSPTGGEVAITLDKVLP